MTDNVNQEATTSPYQKYCDKRHDFEYDNKRLPNFSEMRDAYGGSNSTVKKFNQNFDKNAVKDIEENMTDFFKQALAMQIRIATYELQKTLLEQKQENTEVKDKNQSLMDLVSKLGKELEAKQAEFLECEQLRRIESNKAQQREADLNEQLQREQQHSKELQKSLEISRTELAKIKLSIEHSDKLSRKCEKDLIEMQKKLDISAKDKNEAEKNAEVAIAQRDIFKEQIDKISGQITTLEEKYNQIIEENKKLSEDCHEAKIVVAKLGYGHNSASNMIPEEER